MRKTAFVNPLYFCFIAFGMIYMPSFSQNTAPAASPAEVTPANTMPSDPKALMLLAAKTNGLTGDDIKPWHLKASYKFLDEKGNVTDQGSFEEFWVSPTKYIRTFTGTAFTQTDYGSDKGISRSGARKLPSDLIADVRREFVDPLPDTRSIQYLPFDLKQGEVDGTKFTCVSMKGFNQPAYLAGQTWCFDSASPVLRTSTSTQKMVQIVHNGIVSFQGRSIASELEFIQAGKTVLTAHIESIEPLVTIDESAFVPSPDAIPLPRRINISGGVAAGLLKEKESPSYPPEAKSAHISGTVVMQALISVDGHIEELHVVSGPSALQKAAMDAVKKWVYRPYLLNGEPVEVNTTINVVFTIG